MAPREQVTLQPALAVMLAQHFEYPPIRRSMLAMGRQRPEVLAVGDIEYRAHPVRLQFVRTDDAKITPRLVEAHHFAQIFTQLFDAAEPGPTARVEVATKRVAWRQRQRAPHFAAEAMPVERHASLACGAEREQIFGRRTASIK